MSKEVEATLDEVVVDENETTENPANEQESVELTAPDEPTEQDKVQKRIDKAIYEKHQARREAEQAKREFEEFKARIEQGNENIAPDDIHALIQKEAERLRADESFNEACNKTYDEGVKEFGSSFDKAMQNLSLVGMSREFLELVSEADHGAKILAHLGQDLDEAERIAAMPPLKMARELTKLDVKLGSKPAKPVSKAPPPITPVSGKSGGTKSTYEMTDEEYQAWRRSK